MTAKTSTMGAWEPHRVLGTVVENHCPNSNVIYE